MKFCSALLLLGCSVFGQEKAIILKAARMFDGTSDVVTRNAVIVIEGNSDVPTLVPPARVPAPERTV